MAEEIIQTFYGRVGIGITNPTTDLEVGGSGDIKATNLTVGGVTNAFAPVGLIIMWSGATVPSGWALCDGADDTPDLQDKFIIAWGTSYTAGQTGGAHSKQITTSNLPSHTHTFNSGNAGSHIHTTSMQSSGLHNHVGSIGQGGQHTHVTSSASGGLHTHTPSASNAGGQHNHTGTIANAGAHNHGISTSRVALYNGNADANRADYTCGQPNRVNRYQYHRSSGNHGHNITIPGNVAHTHAAAMQAVANHTHPVSCASNGLHTHTVSVASNGLHTHAAVTAQTNDHTHNYTTGATGDSADIDVMPPYYVLAFIIKT